MADNILGLQLPFCCQIWKFGKLDILMSRRGI